MHVRREKNEQLFFGGEELFQECIQTYATKVESSFDMTPGLDIARYRDANGIAARGSL